MFKSIFTNSTNIMFFVSIQYDILQPELTFPFRKKFKLSALIYIYKDAAGQQQSIMR